MSSLDVVLCLLSRIVVFHSFEPEFACTIPMNISSESLQVLCLMVFRLDGGTLEKLDLQTFAKWFYDHTCGILRHMQDIFG